MELRLQTHETDNVSLVEPLATSTFGLRTIVWTGDGFVLNGSPLFCLGANWIPEGLFPSDRTIEKVRERLQAARDCGMNMIRVWGGGRYEPDWFYDICDELGLMVWQDFMFACACYPEEEPLRSLVEAEARHQVARLSRHPSVVLWCGGNENHWAYQSWGDGGEGFKARLAPGQTWGHGYWHELLPKVIAEVDPSRPYWPDSPWSGDEAVHPNAPDHGDRHSWDVNFWNVWDGGYQKFVPRFCSEFGQQSPSNYATLVQAGLVPLPEGEGGLSPSASGARAVRGDRSTDASDAIENSGVMESTLPNPSLGEGLSESWSAKLMGRMLAHRQRGPGGNRRWYDEPIDAVFRRPRDFDEWHYTAQVIQARAMRTAVEWHRVNRPRCMGALVWQLNDAWPGLSWSLIDSAGRKKPAWYAVRAAMRPRILSIHLVEGELVLFAVNDTDEPWRDTAHATMVGFRGEQPANSRRAPFAVEPRSVGRVMRLDGLVTDASTQLISAMCDSGEENLTAMHFMAADRTLRYPELLLQLDVTSANGRIKIAMAAPAVARDIVLAVDRIDPAAECDDQAFTLVPHEPRAVYIRTGVSIERWRREIRSHICCANALGGG